jgi:hypothetical protein
MRICRRDSTARKSRRETTDECGESRPTVQHPLSDNKTFQVAHPALNVTTCRCRIEDIEIASAAGSPHRFGLGEQSRPERARAARRLIESAPAAACEADRPAKRGKEQS